MFRLPTNRTARRHERHSGCATVLRLLGQALNTDFSFKSTEDASKEDSDAARLGAAMGELAKAGRDKVTLITSPAVSSLGDWIEQLIAESTGKEGKGILPVVGEPTGKPEVYGKDRLFVYLRLAHDETHDGAVHALESAGQPVIQVHLDDIYDLGGQFFLWELVTAVARYRLGINPFDQPDVEAAKVLAREMVATYREEGKIPELEPVLQADGISVYGNLKADHPGEALTLFLDQANGGDYVAIQAYVQPTDDTDQKLIELREKIRNRTKLATTIGYGPRFLHSTGQLHKGDAGHGLFIQFTSDARRDAQIPDEAGSTESSISFGLLKMTQALGDRQALLNAGRRVIRFHLGSDACGGINKLIDILK